MRKEGVHPVRTYTATEFPQFACVHMLRADAKHRRTSAWYDRVLAAVRAGADPSTADKDGQNLLHLAAVFGDTRLALQLVEAGADHGALDRLGRTALMKAEVGPCHGRTHIVLYLRALAAESPNEHMTFQLYRFPGALGFNGGRNAVQYFYL